MEKRVLDRRLRQMEAEGTTFVTGAHVGAGVDVDELRRTFHDALLLTGGACAPRDLPIPGRELGGIRYAMEYLTLQNRRCEGDRVPTPSSSPPRASPSSSSAAATPALIAWAPPTGSALPPSISSRSCPVRPRRARRTIPAPLAQHLPRCLGPRGGGGASTRCRPALHRRRGRPRDGAGSGRGGDDEGRWPGLVHREAGQRVHPGLPARAPGHGLRGTRARGHARALGRTPSPTAATCGGTSAG